MRNVSAQKTLFPSPGTMGVDPVMATLANRQPIFDYIKLFADPASAMMDLTGGIFPAHFANRMIKEVNLRQLGVDA